MITAIIIYFFRRHSFQVTPVFVSADACKLAPKKPIYRVRIVSFVHIIWCHLWYGEILTLASIFYFWISHCTCAIDMIKYDDDNNNNNHNNNNSSNNNICSLFLDLTIKTTTQNRNTIFTVEPRWAFDSWHQMVSNYNNQWKLIQSCRSDIQFAFGVTQRWIVATRGGTNGCLRKWRHCWATFVRANEHLSD